MHSGAAAPFLLTTPVLSQPTRHALLPRCPPSPCQFVRILLPPLLQQAAQQAGQHRLALRHRVVAQRLGGPWREGLAADRALHHACGQDARWRGVQGWAALGDPGTPRMHPVQHACAARLCSTLPTHPPAPAAPADNTQQPLPTACSLRAPHELKQEPERPLPMIDTSASEMPVGYTSLSNSSSGSVELVEPAHVPGMAAAQSNYVQYVCMVGTWVVNAGSVSRAGCTQLAACCTSASPMVGDMRAAPGSHLPPLPPPAQLPWGSSASAWA